MKDINEKINKSLCELLKPIRDNEIAGSKIRYSDLYFQIKELRASASILNPSDKAYSESIKVWKDLSKKIHSALSSNSKDLELSLWYIESESHSDGLIGFIIAIKFLQGLHESYWNEFFPELDSGLEERVSALNFLNHKKVISALMNITLEEVSIDGSIIRLSDLYKYANLSSNSSSEFAGIEKFVSSNHANKIALEYFVEMFFIAYSSIIELENCLNKLYIDCDGIDFSNLKNFFETIELFINRHLSSFKKSNNIQEINESLNKELDNKVSIIEEGQDFKLNRYTCTNNDEVFITDKEQFKGFDYNKIYSESFRNGIEIFSNLIKKATSKRGCFIIKLHLIEFCIIKKQHLYLQPLLEELTSLFEKHLVDEWEEEGIRSLYWKIKCMHSILSYDDDFFNDNEKIFFDNLCKIDIKTAINYAELRRIQ